MRLAKAILVEVLLLEITATDQKLQISLLGDITDDDIAYMSM